MSKSKFSTTLPKDLLIKIRQMSKESGRHMSHIIEMALRIYLEMGKASETERTSERISE